MPAVIDVRNIGRYFGEIKAVDGVSFQVSQGDVLGFLGPNGAGKSTTMRILTTFLTPSFGKASVGGFDTVEQAREVQRLIGYLPENAPLYSEMEVLQFLKFVTDVRAIRPELKKSALDRVIQLTGLSGVLQQRIETLSRGYKRRVGLAQALIHDPAILILDEPTDGLDPNQKHDVRQLISTMAKDKCIILSTHILEEVDAVCNRVIIIANGKIVADSTPQELRKRSKSSSSMTFSLKTPPHADVKAELQKLPGVASVSEWRTHDGVVHYTVAPKGEADLSIDVLRELNNRGWRPATINVGVGQLDEVFRSLTQ